MNYSLRLILSFIMMAVFSHSFAFVYHYDVVEHFTIDRNIESEPQKPNYDGTANLRYCCSEILNSDIQKKALDGSFFTLADGFVVAKEGHNLIYRSGSRSATNLTPRAKDTTGLSANLQPMPGKNQVIDTSKLNNLCATCDNPKTGHVSITPKDMNQMQDWIDSRGGNTVHLLTQELIDAVVDTIKK